ncbi:transposase [Streptomyces sp. NPDC051677]|uniref:IS110 family transposase n=1 Tax=Streptomyces sp. NPDC051677 TaxID=3365669 RepID=UPI0037CD81C1
MDNSATRVPHREFAHTEEGIARTLAKLATYRDPADLPVAIETTRGLVVDRLPTAGHPVVAVHPNAFHAMRPRWGASKAKTDAGDSLKLADYRSLPAQPGAHRARHHGPSGPHPAARRPRRGPYRRWQPARRAARHALAGGKAVFAGLDSDIALAFLERYPTPASAARLTAERLETGGGCAAATPANGPAAS